MRMVLAILEFLGIVLCLCCLVKASLESNYPAIAGWSCATLWAIDSLIMTIDKKNGGK